MERQFERVSHDFNRERNAVARLKEEATRLAPITDENGEDLPLKQQLNDLPDNMTELDEAIDDTQDKISSIHDNPEVMRRYERQKQELEAVQEELENLNESKERRRKDLKEKRAPWENALENIVKKVNVLFSEYMKELGCAGKVVFSSL